jgi:hypothetical protein
MAALCHRDGTGETAKIKLQYSMRRIGRMRPIRRMNGLAGEGSKDFAVSFVKWMVLTE